MHFITNQRDQNTLANSAYVINFVSYIFSKHVPGRKKMRFVIDYVNYHHHEPSKNKFSCFLLFIYFKIFNKEII